MNLRRANEGHIHLIAVETRHYLVAQSFLKDEGHQRKCLPERADGLRDQRIKRRRRGYSNAQAALFTACDPASRLDGTIEIPECGPTLPQKRLTRAGQLHP